MNIQIIDKEIVDLINRYAEITARRHRIDADDFAGILTDRVLVMVRNGLGRDEILKMIKINSTFSIINHSRKTQRLRKIQSEMQYLHNDMSTPTLTPEEQRLNIIRKRVGKFAYFLALGYTNREAAKRCGEEVTKRNIKRLRCQARARIEELQLQGVDLHERDWADYAI